MENDILQEISDEDLPILRDLYESQQTTAPQVYSLLNTAISWNKKKPNSNYLTFFSVNGNWLKTGTFILLMQYNCYDIFVFTLENDCEGLYKGLTQTKKIDYKNKIIWYATSSKHTPTVLNALEQIKPLSCQFGETELWVIEKERASQFKIICPDNIYIKKLDKSHAKLVNSHWPHRYEGSEGYVGTFIEMNNCYGVFLKCDDSLVSWVLKNHLGQLGILQTLPEHTRKGYASLVTKFLAKEIADEGHNPLGTVVRGNVASETMFSRLGFRSIDVCTYIESAF